MVSQQISQSTARQNELVDRVYRKTNLVSTYANIKLLPAEAAALIRYRDDFLNRRVLDMGCGAGRLAVYLQPLVSSYTGFDISAYMIDHCRREHPDSEFVEGDMRDLSAFADGSFDSILAVSNLFDAVSHADRQRVLAEVHRTLVPGGLLLFSAHNRNFKDAGQGPTLTWHRNPITQIHELADYWQASLRHRQLKQQQRFEDEYALINDSGNNYSTLHYYVSRTVQLRQLTISGFVPEICLDSMGQVIHEGMDDSDFPSIHYVCRRASE